jgi:hypothetical protein
MQIDAAIVVIFEGEIRFGPVYFKLALNGHILGKRIFGDDLAWSEDSSLLAVQEWLTTDYGKGPVTRAVLIDPVNRKWTGLRTVEKGFAKDFLFSKGQFIYKKHFNATCIIEEVEVALSNINNWDSSDFSVGR